MNILQLAEQVKLKANYIAKKENISIGSAYKKAYKELNKLWGGLDVKN